MTNSNTYKPGPWPAELWAWIKRAWWLKVTFPRLIRKNPEAYRFTLDVQGRPVERGRR